MKMKKAAAGTAATKNKLHNQAYRKPSALSGSKLAIGELLLAGNRQRREFWPFFEATLRQYVDVRLASQGASETPQSNRERRRVSG